MRWPSFHRSGNCIEILINRRRRMQLIWCDPWRVFYLEGNRHIGTVGVGKLYVNWIFLPQWVMR